MNLIKSKILLLIATLALPGCILNVDRPNPEEYESWIAPKNGDQVEIVMLECGYPDLKGTLSPTFGFTELVAAGQCMRSNGYKPIEKGKDQLCKWYPDLTSCSNNPKPIFHRSKENRMNSDLCKKYPKSIFCT